MTIMPCIFLIVLSIQAQNNQKVDLPWWVGFGIEIMYIIYFSLLAYFFWSGSWSSKGNNLYRVWTLSGRSMYI